MIEKLITWFDTNIRQHWIKRLMIHSAFWSVWLFRTFYDLISFGDLKSSLLFLGVYFITQVPLIYIHLYLFVPKFLNQKKYSIYVISTLLLIFIYSYLNHFLLQSIPDSWLSATMAATIDRLKPFYDVLEGFFAVLITYALKYTWIAFTSQNEVLKLQKEKLMLELNALKAQVNPHFFFNTLNNLYSLTLKKSSLSPDIVLKLSDIMRYVLYECNDEKVLISKEIQFVRNYMDLERIRHDDRYQIDFVLEGDPEEYKIIPMMWIEFIENGFKHGLNNNFSGGYIFVLIRIEKGELYFRIRNSKGEKQKSNSKGIGLVNVKRRLELIYPHKHKLDIEENKNEFTISLNLSLN